MVETSHTTQGRSAGRRFWKKVAANIGRTEIVVALIGLSGGLGSTLGGAWLTHNFEHDGVITSFTADPDKPQQLLAGGHLRLVKICIEKGSSATFDMFSPDPRHYARVLPAGQKCFLEDVETVILQPQKEPSIVTLQIFDVRSTA